MADAFTHLCVEVPCASDEAREWVRRQVQALANYQEAIEEVESYGDALVLFNHAWGTDQLDPDVAALVPDWDPLAGDPLPGFSLKEDGSGMYIQDDGGSVDVYRVAHFFQVYLQRCDPKGCIAFEYAFTSNKASTDAYGGGACFLTADSIGWVATNNWISEKLAAWAAAQRKETTDEQR